MIVVAIKQLGLSLCLRWEKVEQLNLKRPEQRLQGIFSVLQLILYQRRQQA